MKRRDFITTAAGVTEGATVISSPLGAALNRQSKKKIAMVGTGGEQVLEGNELLIIKRTTPGANRRTH